MSLIDRLFGSGDLLPTPPEPVPIVVEDQDHDPDLQELTPEEILAAEECERTWDYAGNAARFEKVYRAGEGQTAEDEATAAAVEAAENRGFIQGWRTRQAELRAGQAPKVSP